MPDDKNERWRRLAERLQARWEARLAELRKAGSPQTPDSEHGRAAHRRKVLEPLGQIQMICAGMAPGSVTESAEGILQKADAARVARARAEEERPGSATIPPPAASEGLSVDEQVADPEDPRPPPNS